MNSCIECPHHKVVNDPDPYDSFCMDDVAVLCTLAPNSKESKRYSDNALFPFKPVAVSCRPYRIVEETTPTPSWCSLNKGIVPT